MRSDTLALFVSGAFQFLVSGWVISRVASAMIFSLGLYFQMESTCWLHGLTHRAWSENNPHLLLSGPFIVSRIFSQYTWVRERKSPALIGQPQRSRAGFASSRCSIAAFNAQQIGFDQHIGKWSPAIVRHFRGALVQKLQIRWARVFCPRTFSASCSQPHFWRKLLTQPGLLRRSHRFSRGGNGPFPATCKR